ncbi:MAG: hypothetical protein Q8L20_10760 [Gammaproteobacteria bacterium]|nr:hypothetical protein [Gammaproteobacteria bacterium]
MHFKLLITQQTPFRGRNLIQALLRGAMAAGVSAEIVGQHSADPESVLMLYGMGGADRLPLAESQVRSGGRLVVFDAGYWDRALTDNARRYRVSIDGLHPPAFVMKGNRPDPSRWQCSGLSITNTGGNPGGPILLAGNGPKSNAIGAQGWSEMKSREIRAAFPGRKIAYRPKPKKPAERGVSCDLVSTCSIEQAVAGASLVVCRHSNVAVDACRAGVPVVCEDGAAAAIYPSLLADAENQPDEQTRIEFLHRLAWWQWSPDECARGAVWPWLIGVLNAGV